MTTLKLSYFDFHGGRGEVARIALFIGKIPFEDDRFPFSEWPVRKPNTPFHAVPVLAIDGVELAQCNGINRYVGKLTGLYPEDPLQAAFCDEAMDLVEDWAPKILATFGIKDPEELKAARTALAEGPLPFFLKAAEARLEARGGAYFADSRLTVADLKVYLWLRHIRKGNLDHIPADLPDRVAPKLVEHTERVRNDPRVAAYYESKGID